MGTWWSIRQLLGTCRGSGCSRHGGQGNPHGSSWVPYGGGGGGCSGCLGCRGRGAGLSEPRDRCLVREWGVGGGGGD